ncbi:MAG: M48 family metalloprotease [Actinomycetota bacterium]|nr:M48 family metalloprotease [Actinomycetota bacterium]MDP4642631.1 M48 family metalloprotease [Ilumatobacteraceae bacterium]
MSGRSLRFEWSALTGVTAIIALLPAWLVTASVVWLPFGWWGKVNYWLFVGSLFSLFILLFSRPVQRFVLMRLLGARNPTSREQAILAESWQPIVQRNKLQRRQFVLAVVDTESLNAFACGGHLVVVSSQAIEQLDSKQLSGVLAHELSHHLGLHTVALTITQWMILPITVLSRVGMRLRAVAENATIAFAQRIPLLHALGLFVAAFLHVASWLLMLNVSLATLLGNAASRATEFHADRRAAQLGFGNHLLAAMRNWDAGAQRTDRGNVWQRIFESHPPMRLRINKLALYLRQYGRA